MRLPSPRPSLATLPLVLATACGGGSSSGGSSLAPPNSGPTLGLDARPPNASCVAPAPAGSGTAEIALERVFAALSFSEPLAMLQAPDRNDRWLVLEKGGTVRAFANDPQVSAFDPDFLRVDVNASGEGGLLGMAFHPAYPTDGRVLVSFTEGTSPMTSVVATFTSANGGATLDPGSRQDVIRVNQDASNHNGGHVAFGPDGYLYFGLGDGGGGGDPLDRAQETTNLLGALLRVDVDGASPYAIPSGPEGNPFAGGPFCPADHSASWNCPEIFAWGLRNPWRFSFDRDTQTLWLADVGQNAREEIDVIERGGNYGWDCREGLIEHANASPACADADASIDPVHDYPRTLGQSVTGGYVYRGSAIPSLAGHYVFGDFVSGRIWRLVADGHGGYVADELLDTELQISSFGEGLDGELYVVDFGGTLHRIVAAPNGANGAAAAAPQRLSDTGCVDGADASAPSPGLIPYDVAAPAWFDGATRERFLAIPDRTALAVDADGRLVLPVGSVLMERISLDGSPIEVRLLMHHADGDWGAYTYEWDDGLRDGVLVAGGKTIDVGGRQWVLPASADCFSCHRESAGVALGLEIAQLNRAFTYPATGRTANQLATLDGIALFASRVGAPDVLPALPSPTDASAAEDARARAYLHANCAHCHGSSGVAGLDLRYDTPLASTGACDAAPSRGDLGIENARIIAPGDAARSVLVERMSRRDAHGMPPLATLVPDDAGIALVAAWIDGLAGCG